MSRIAAVEDPVLRHLLVGRCYHVLGREIAKVVDQQNLNWSTFACWAAKAAGVSIRSERLQDYFKNRLGLGGGDLRFVSRFTARFLSIFGLSRFVQTAALEALREASLEVIEGNRKVFSEIALLFARFIDLMRKNPTDSELDTFKKTLQSGPIEEGGQELLKKAFSAWYDASRSESAGLRAQLILRGNCQIGFHEQSRLQPHIQAGLDAPIRSIFSRQLRRALPSLIAAPLAALVRFLVASFVHELSKLWIEVATRYALSLNLPSGAQISLEGESPAPEERYPADLQVLSDPKTEALIERFDDQLSTMHATDGTNWAEVQERMGFIVEFFRARQQDLGMFAPPFTPEQDLSLEEGDVPGTL